MFGFLTLFLAAMPLTSCDKDNDDNKSSSNGNGKTSGWVEIGNKKFDVKYGYIVDYSYDYEDEIEFTFSDTDLSDIFKGKSFKKTISMIDFWFDEDIYDRYAEIEGGYKVYVDSREEDAYTKSSDSFFFEYEANDSDFNPKGSSFETDRSGKSYTFDGDGLKAELWSYDEDDYYETDLGMMSFSFSIKSTPQDITDYIIEMESRGIEMTVITDPEQKKLFRKYFGRK